MADRPDIHYPKFKDRFSVLDFEAERGIPVISLFKMPAPLIREEAILTGTGLDGVEQDYAWDKLKKLPSLNARRPLICQIFNWAEKVHWKGWRLREVLDLMGLAGKENRYYAFHSRDGEYFESLSHEEAMDERSLVAFGMGGAELDLPHGGPLRVVVPFLQGYKSVKWLTAIQAHVKDPLGIKILLHQSKTAKLSSDWKRKYTL